MARRVRFERGDVVKLGDILPELNAEAERAALNLSAERADFARWKMGRNPQLTIPSGIACRMLSLDND